MPAIIDKQLYVRNKPGRPNNYNLKTEIDTKSNDVNSEQHVPRPFGSVEARRN